MSDFNLQEESDNKRLLRLGIDPELPPIILYLMLQERVRTVEALFERLREKARRSDKQRGE
jgi:hypothetical protein